MQYDRKRIILHFVLIQLDEKSSNSIDYSIYFMMILHKLSFTENCQITIIFCSDTIWRNKMPVSVWKVRHLPSFSKHCGILVVFKIYSNESCRMLLEVFKPQLFRSSFKSTYFLIISYFFSFSIFPCTEKNICWVCVERFREINLKFPKIQTFSQLPH